jgi:hypothetical protein
MLATGPHPTLVGYPGCEFQIRHALGEAIGQEKSEFFFDKVRLPSVLIARLTAVEVPGVLLHGV